jgi:NADPH-dependent stearoyl-CoA 9-desaturase
MPLPTHLSAAAIAELGSELDAIRAEVLASRNDSDARYIRRVIKTQRTLALSSRLVIYASLALLPRWGHALASYAYFGPFMALGVAMLAAAKILENMEIGHNVSHAQWDWMRDPQIQSGTWEWDHFCPSDQWKHSHNVVHHTWTNVIGKDDDVGYGLLRLFPEQRWRPFYLGQPLYAVVLALQFELGVAIQELRLGRILSGRATLASIRPALRVTGRKILRQVLKDYVLWPMLAGPFFVYVVLANAAANVLRNVWTFLIIFCGHFPRGVSVFSKAEVEGETRAGWYVRQILGSCNIRGGALFDIFSGNLSHQIEHHLFPDLPSNRYSDIAPRVRSICARYRLAYNEGSFGRQVGTTALAILRMALPPRAAQTRPPAQATAPP